MAGRSSGRRVDRTMWLLDCLLLVLVSTACTPAVDGRVESAGAPVVILVSGTSSEPTPSLSESARAVLESDAQGDDAAAIVFPADGDPFPTLPLTPRRADGSVEHGLRRDDLIGRNVADVERTVAGVRARVPGLDPLGAISEAVRGRPPGTLVVASNGLATRGALDLREIGWSFDPAEIVDALRARGDLPELGGWQVLFTDLGDTSGPVQPPLTAAVRDRLVDLWLTICRSGGAVSCEADTARRPGKAPEGVVPTPVVPVPTVTSISGTEGTTTTTVPDSLLGFAGDSAEIVPAADDTLRGIAADIAHRAVPGRVRVTGYTADPPGATSAATSELSAQRAEAVAGRLRALGVHAPLTAAGQGVAPGPSSTTADGFDPVRAAQMRFVSITYRALP